MASVIQERSRVALQASMVAGGLAVTSLHGFPVSIGGSGVTVDPSNLQASANPLIAAWDWSDAAQLARDLADNKASATSYFQSPDSIAIILRSVAIAMISEINLLRERLVAQDNAIATASSLLNLQTQWAALAASKPMPDRTAAQAKTAVLNDIPTDTGS